LSSMLTGRHLVAERLIQVDRDGVVSEHIQSYQAVFDVMADTPQHTYQLLTKRPRRLARMAQSLPWPANVWMGVSVERQDQAWRINELVKVPAAVRFVSAEPLLGPLTLDLTNIDWLIAGGESGANHRPVEKEWVEHLRDQCLASIRGLTWLMWLEGDSHGPVVV